MRQKVKIKLTAAADRTGLDEMELAFEASGDSESGLVVILTKEQAVSLGKVIRAKYGDD